MEEHQKAYTSIDRKNYNSKYFLSLGISYPNAQDEEICKKAWI